MLYATELRARAWIIATYRTASNFRMIVPDYVPAGSRHPALVELDLTDGRMPRWMGRRLSVGRGEDPSGPI
jgi:hypothetical protein